MTTRGGGMAAMTFLLRIETISEICEELKLVRRNGKTGSSGGVHKRGPFPSCLYLSNAAVNKSSKATLSPEHWLLQFERRAAWSG
jgi:hypothetical protein